MLKKGRKEKRKERYENVTADEWMVVQLGVNVFKQIPGLRNLAQVDVGESSLHSPI